MMNNIYADWNEKAAKFGEDWRNLGSVFPADKE